MCRNTRVLPIYSLPEWAGGHLWGVPWTVLSNNCAEWRPTLLDAVTTTTSTGLTVLWYFCITSQWRPAAHNKLQYKHPYIVTFLVVFCGAFICLILYSTLPVQCHQGMFTVMTMFDDDYGDAFDDNDDEDGWGGGEGGGGGCNTICIYCREVMENLTFMFSSAEKRAMWEEAFNDAKHKLGKRSNTSALKLSFSFTW